MSSPYRTIAGRNSVYLAVVAPSFIPEATKPFMVVYQSVRSDDISVSSWQRVPAESAPGRTDFAAVIQWPAMPTPIDAFEAHDTLVRILSRSHYEGYMPSGRKQAYP